MEKNLVKTYKQIKENCKIFEIKNEKLLEISGEDAKKFLHPITTNNINNLNSNQGIYSAILQRNGKLICDLKIYNINSKLLITTTYEKENELINFLTKRIFMSKVKIKSRTKEFKTISIQGKKSQKVISEALNINLNKMEENEIRKIKETQDDKKETYIMKNKRSLYANYDIHTNTNPYHYIKKLNIKINEIKNIKENENNNTSENNKNQNIYKKIKIQNEKDKTNIEKEEIFSDPKLLEILRLEAGIALWGKDISEKQNPYESNIEHALNFKKGCYIGQEVIARLKYKAKEKSKFLLTKININTKENIQSKSKIYLNKEEAGYLTSSIYSEEFKQTIALAYIKRKLITKNEQYTIINNKNQYKGSIAKT